ncbi:DUF2079 domain-containing protein [Nonomuraea sp. NEAU-A123]|uniref:DUF2079 domain-containing protein n=1 Tax=Nonomuraea sp. NEAU-A123 TaxID=2839649 RepID=UPI001BE3EE2B|nr:DUF2079 domain-containing protein [Nonomuraea sp. NEAU-A123]MBT2228054.1 DUF2079 domain-containing protein [Nonomuraea sp. NEAU-A123]
MGSEQAVTTEALTAPDTPEVGARTRRDRVTLAAITATAAALYTTLSLTRLANFKAGAYDLVIFDQAVRSYAQFRLPIAIVKGIHNGFGPGFSTLGDHWSPILALLAPLYWLFDGPKTLLVAQAVLLAAAAIPLWVFTRRALGPGAAHLVAVAYTLSWPVLETVAFDFHEAAFAPLLTAVLLERRQAGKRVAVVVAALALLCVKEDMGLLVAGFGTVLLAQRGWRVLGGAFVVGGAAYTWLASQVLIPLFGGRSDYYWAYGALGPDMGGVARTALTDPLAVLAQLGSPPVKLVTLTLLLGVTLMAAPLSPLLIMAVPLLAERMLASSFPNWWVPGYHYNAFIVVVVFAAGVDGVQRLRSRGGDRVPRFWALGVAGVALASVPFFSLADLADLDSYRHDARERAAAAAVAVVPDGALVEAANNLAPALSGRSRVLLWDRTHRGAPWVVADVGRRIFPFANVTEQQDRVRFLVGSGYQVRFSQDGYVVLAATGRTTTTPGLP